MKKSRFLVFVLFFVMIIGGGVFLFSGCKNETSANNNASGNAEKIPENCQTENPAYLNISSVTAELGRTVLPVFTDEDLALSGYAFTLTGKKSDSDTIENLGSFETRSELEAAHIGIETGNWTFTLTAAKAGTAFNGTLEKEIVDGSNSLDFTLTWDENALTGTGNLSYTVDYSSATNKSYVQFVTREIVQYNPETKAETTLSSYKEAQITRGSDYTASFSLPEFDAGVYRIKIRLYADTAKKIPLLNSPYTELAIITDGYTSSSTAKITALNSPVYNISYDLDLGTVPSGSTLPKIYQYTGSVPVLPEPVRTGYTFKGWYTKADPTSSDVPFAFSGTTPLTDDIKLYAVWDLPEGFVYVEGMTLTDEDAAKFSNSQVLQSGTSITSMWVCDHEVTQEEYEKYGQYGYTYEPSYTSNDGRVAGKHYPAININWNMAVKYCNKRSSDEGYTPVYYVLDGQEKVTNPDNFGSNEVLFDKTANGYRLPTRAEWEYIARGGKALETYDYSGSNDADEVAWFKENSDGKIHQVKGKAPNSLGIYDMSGNVIEHCWDQVNGYKANRGGCYSQTAQTIYDQGQLNPGDQWAYTGFRVVRTLSVGDVLLTNGTVIPYKSGRAFTNDEKATAVGVMYGVNEDGITLGWVGKYNPDSSPTWAKEGSTGVSTKFENIVCTKTSVSNILDSVTFTGDFDGSDNWSEIRSADPDGTATDELIQENYPAFYYVNNYGTTAGSGYLSTTKYKDGWYMPSIVELIYIFKNRKISNSVLTSLGGNTNWTDTASSSQHPTDASAVWTISVENATDENNAIFYIVASDKSDTRDIRVPVIRK